MEEQSETTPSQKRNERQRMAATPATSCEYNHAYLIIIYQLSSCHNSKFKRLCDKIAGIRKFDRKGIRLQKLVNPFHQLCIQSETIGGHNPTRTVIIQREFIFICFACLNRCHDIKSPRSGATSPFINSLFRVKHCTVIKP